jgi:Fic-DOC domain mobile mystery protein B
VRLRYPEGATPLNPDVLAALIPDLSTQEELNEFEAQNIAGALRWALRSRTLKRDLLTRFGLALLHKRMFDQTWRWAGKFRTTDTNIGVPWHQVPTLVQNLCDDTRYQLENAVYGWDELAARFHHRLVWIHPFPNGNGRHARLATDLLLAYNKQPMFTWGAVSLVADSTTRQEYLSALREADAGKFSQLLGFVRS